MIGTTELIIIVVVILILFGATAIPKFARSLGRAKKEFEKGLREGQLEEDEEVQKKGEEKKKLDKGSDQGGQEG
jgi:sec-independent protein translocase protein TatA